MTFRGGMQYGNPYTGCPSEAMVAKWPFAFAHLKIDEKALELSMPFKSVTFPRDHVVRIYVLDGFFSKGLRIEHDMDDRLDMVMFWPARSQLQSVIDCLKENGYVFFE